MFNHKNLYGTKQIVRHILEELRLDYKYTLDDWGITNQEWYVKEQRISINEVSRQVDAFERDLEKFGCVSLGTAADLKELKRTIRLVESISERVRVGQRYDDWGPITIMAYVFVTTPKYFEEILNGIHPDLFI